MAILRYESSFAIPKLEPLDIHIWCFSLATETDPTTWLDVLSNDERQRTGKFRFTKDASRFAATRGILRNLLGRYLMQTPESLDFCYTEFGKPYVADSKLEFNVSHTADVALFAISEFVPLGVDIEQRKTVEDLDAVARQCLSPKQLDQFIRLEPDQKNRAFFRFWTRKEALVKATGRGLTQAFKDIDVTFLDGESPKLIRAVSGFDPLDSWTLNDLDVSNRHQASLASCGSAGRLQIIRSL